MQNSPHSTPDPLPLPAVDRGTSRHRSFWRVIVILIVGGLIMLGWALYDQQFERPYVAPDVTITALDGKSYTLSQLRGKTIVLNFWASWCKPCEFEARTLQYYAEQYAAHDVIFLGVAIHDTREAAEFYLTRFGVTYPNGLDNGISDAFRVQGLPTTLIINPQGIVTKTFFAAVAPQKLVDAIDQAKG